MSENDRVRAHISAIVDDIVESHAALLALGIDAREPEDRDALDILARIERRVLSMEAPHKDEKVT